MSEPANTTENGDESVVLSLNDVLELEDELIENTAAVLGAANDKTCSFVEGYAKRQALYSCLTCISEAKTDLEKGAGICLACSYHCHEGHELIELYTKRNFRCDCGNKKFTNMTCNLFEDKPDFNELNQYNQNFSGLYCVCHRPYPDPEDQTPDEMIQCIICEDWYHARHLGTEVPSNNFAEMICQTCIAQHEFLLHYDGFCTKKINSTTEETPVDVETPTSSITEAETSTICKKPKTKSENITAKFWQDINWRKHLCICDDCLKMYEDEDVSFLLDSDDPVHLYEEKGKQKAKEIVESHDRDLMNSMPRVQLIECIAGYNDLKDQLGEYLKKFAENKKVVRKEDIQEFFEGMNARKRQRTEIPHFCR